MSFNQKLKEFLPHIYIRKLLLPDADSKCI